MNDYSVQLYTDLAVQAAARDANDRDFIVQAFPDEAQRLQHIFEHQVYGLAPTEIIYQIALHFILGFDGGELIEKHYLRQCDALPLAKEGTLETRLDSIFG